MTIIQIYHPLQDKNTSYDKLQSINGEYPDWCVVSEYLKVGQSYQDWILKKKDHCEKQGIPGIYLYNIESIFVQPEETTLMIRYAYIKFTYGNTI